MNIYIVAEGEVGEKKVYKHWIPFVNSNLTYVADISEILRNNFAITIGGGFPNYFDVIEAGIEEVNDHNNIDRFVIAIDSEELEHQEKYREIEDFVSDFECSAEIKIVVQHFCLETWALGNKHIIRPSPHSTTLKEYKRIFDVRSNDPELLPPHSKEGMNRAQFAEKYLRRALNDKFRNLTYSKKNPTALLHKKYFERVKSRCLADGHIASFNNFLLAFQ